MNKDLDREVTTENEPQDREPEGIEVKEAAAGGLVVSEFDRAPLTDVNFGF